MQSLKRIAVFLLAFIMALQVIISPSYADWEVSGGGNGSSGVAGDGTYVDDMQGLRITIIDGIEKEKRQHFITCARHRW
ncbi:hypothetical protein [Flavonifractor sp. An306]|uniref:hypothetical protein n=1 Tax=Flavonifractor sp. An306 TaxID=1965629 RepID=UPI001120D2B2|nr:hypothetical protein [Flavonifractor sp. An306]